MAVIKYSENEVDILARLMRAEAVGEGESGMLMVGNVVVNRVLCMSLDFKDVNTVTQVVFQTPGGFSGARSDLFKASATDEEKKLALRVLNGEKIWPASNALWFYAPKKNESCRTTWFKQQNSGRFKSHCFYYPDAEQCKI